MANHIFILAAVMSIAGVFGGLINYYQLTQERDDEAALPRCIVLGIGAAFLVPVILFFVQSDLITQIQEDPSRLLIYTGFCLIVAIGSRLVLTSTPKRILREAQVARNQVEAMQHELRVMQEELLPLLDTETEQDTEIDDNAGPLNPNEELDIAASKVLKTLGVGRHIYRSMAGLCREAGADETTIQKSLNVLVNRQLAGKLNTRKGVRWYLTEKGRRALDLLV
ncbi:YEATS-associated helix-containing protein [Marinimicrobium sp. LS-A18]|uniref:YEATS-associated helix-containing protein n=1 Tax=Marinimicrobium sp. LS-A18 TaxID=1381596 RepID=UPI000466DECE|nr:YEATS-associated helix-containing protein [Marinimicrobium sp. LS-A18]